MTDDEIIKVLEDEIHLAEYVDSDYCSNVNLEIIKSALDLITRQKAEIERLGKEVNLVSIQFQDLQERYEEAQAKIDKLKECPKCVYEYDGEIMEYCVQGPCSNFKTVGQVKAEAYKECIEKVRKLAVGMHPCSDELRIFDSDLDNLLKEIEGKNSDR